MQKNHFSSDIIIMFSERIGTVERNENPEQLDSEQLNTGRQMKKLARFYAHDGDWNYIFNSDKEGYKEDELTSDEAREAQRVLVEDRGLEGKEKELLKNIQGPVNRYGAGAVFDGMARDKHQRRILGYMVGGIEGWKSYGFTSGDNVASFVKKYPTPIHFEGEREDFLQRIRRSGNSEEKIREYEDAMEEFQQRVYGKRYEYYKAMRELHKEANEADATKPDIKVSKTERIKSRFAEIFERDPVVKDAGLAMLNKGDLVGNPNRINEDAAYYNPEIGMFGVFDGAGGMRGAALASQIGRDTVVREVSERVPETPYELGQILMEANEATIGKGYSTAVIGRILETRGRKALIYASVGDSRIYVVRNGQAVPLTKDEGYGNRITNALGIENCRVRQAGEFPLKDGDRVVFCSDGVTGDYEPDFIPNDEFAGIVGGATTADLAAWSLINRATKRDDRTAIVAEV